jgi:hypothetical protein
LPLDAPPAPPPAPLADAPPLPLPPPRAVEPPAPEAPPADVAPPFPPAPPFAWEPSAPHAVAPQNAATNEVVVTNFARRMTNPRERDRISVAKRLGRQADVREPPDRRIGRTIAIRAIEASKIVAVPDRGSPDVKRDAFGLAEDLRRGGPFKSLRELARTHQMVVADQDSSSVDMTTPTYGQPQICLQGKSCFPSCPRSNARRTGHRARWSDWLSHGVKVRSTVNVPP